MGLFFHERLRRNAVFPDNVYFQLMDELAVSGERSDTRLIYSNLRAQVGRRFVLQLATVAQI